MQTFSLHISNNKLLKTHLNYYFKSLGFKRLKEGGQLVISNDTNINTLTDLLLSIHHTYPDSKFCYLSSSKIYDVPEMSIEKTEESYHLKNLEYTLIPSHKNPMLWACDNLAHGFCYRNHINSVVFRLGCIVGYKHKEAAGFLSELCRQAKIKGKFIINGYDGQQVRDMLHWKDLGKAITKFNDNPSIGEIYDVGGGYWNSISVNQAVDLVKSLGYKFKVEYNNSQDGKPIYISNLKKMIDTYDWIPEIDIISICKELLE